MSWRVIQQFSIVGLVVLTVGLGQTTQARADALVVPFTCTMASGEPRLSPASETTYDIVGPRDEQTFASCRGGASANCVTMMVHRFTLSCGEKRMPWAKFAAAARAHGVQLPTNLPSGYAPVSSLAGRFVLPSLTKLRATAPAMPVATQELSPDSVIDHPANTESFKTRLASETWTTIVRADAVPVPDSGLGKLAAAVATMMALLLGASAVAAGRVPGVAIFSGQFARETIHALRTRIIPSLRTTLSGAVAKMRRVVEDSCDAWQRTEHAHPAEALKSAALILQARLAETELLVATLPDGLLLRDVLQSEIDRVRERGMDCDRNMKRRSPDKSSAIFRGLLRELDRISRIAQGAAQSATEDTEAPQPRPVMEMPRTAHEAYRLLGLNADAPPAVAKKLVDALRMTWHPDYARDDSDRHRREERMKQINTAWDIIKERRAAA